MQPSPYSFHYSLHPNVYVAPFISKPLNIDGNIYKDEWNHIPYSNDFDDIRGINDAPSRDRPSLACRTRFKMMYDNQYLYIAAMIESDMEVVAKFKERNSPIYHSDSDFEVFIDPESSCQNYKELEMNAINTVWNLMLDKPYMDGGHEHSARVAEKGEDDYYEVKSQQTATVLLEGNLNDDTKGSRVVWGVEIALAHVDTVRFQKQHKVPPQRGNLWRINFSRVEKQGDINWTWQPQRIWDGNTGSYMGKVNMHLPDAWGYVRFGPPVSKNSTTLMTTANAATSSSCHLMSTTMGQVPRECLSKEGDDFWPLRLAVMNVYYSQRHYFETHGCYAKTMDELNHVLDQQTMDPFREHITLKFSNDDDDHSSLNSSYTVEILDDFGRYISLDSESRCIKVWREDISFRKWASSQ